MNFSSLPVGSCPVLSCPVSASPRTSGAPTLNPLLCVSLNLFHCVRVFLVLGKLEWDPVLEMWFHWHWEEGKDLLPYLLAMLSLIAAIGLPNYLISA